MNKKLISITCIALVVSILLSACDISITINPTSAPVPADTPRPTATKVAIPTDAPAHEMYASSTGSREIPFVILHQKGERLGLTQDINSSRPSGVVWSSSSGNSIVIYADSVGMPKSAVVGEDIILYSNYTSTTVDLTIVHPDGTRDVFRAKYDTDLLNKITAIFSPTYSSVAFSVSNPHITQQGVDWDKIKTALYILGAGVCVYGIVQSAGQLTVALAQACAGPILETVVRVGKITNLNVGGLEDLSDNLGAVGCLNFNSALDCASFWASQMEKQKEPADARVTNIPPEPIPTKKKYP